MQRKWIIVSVSMLVGCGYSAKSDADRLQGSWEHVSVEYDGQSRDAAKAGTWVFEGQSVAGDEDTATFKLDPAKTPKTIDIIRENQKVVQRGIYSFEEDKLKMCFGGQERPTEFITGPGSGRTLLVLKRTTP